MDVTIASKLGSEVHAEPWAVLGQAADADADAIYHHGSEGRKASLS